MEQKLKVALITGAARGLGLSIANEFRQAGYQVFATARDITGKNNETALTWMHLDVTSAQSCEEAIAETFARFGRLDVLVNNASGYTGGDSFVSLTDEEVTSELNTTLLAPMLLSKAYTTHAKDQGSGKIIFISSAAGLLNNGSAGEWAAYSATKAALLRFSECLQGDLYSYGMQSHVIVPDNIRESEDVMDLIKDSATSYKAVSKAILYLTEVDGNISISRLDIRPAVTST